MARRSGSVTELRWRESVRFAAARLRRTSGNAGEGDVGQDGPDDAGRSFTLPGRFLRRIDLDGLLVATETSLGGHPRSELLARPRSRVHGGATAWRRSGRSVDHSSRSTVTHRDPASGNAALRASWSRSSGRTSVPWRPPPRRGPAGRVARRRPADGRGLGQPAVGRGRGPRPAGLAGGSTRSCRATTSRTRSPTGPVPAGVPPPGVDPADASRSRLRPRIRPRWRRHVLRRGPSPGVDPFAAHLALPSLEAVVVTGPVRP